MFCFAGPALTSPVYTSNCDPCHGHWTVPHIMTPSERGGPNALHGERERPAALLARQPAERKQRQRADIDEGVPGRTFFRRALRRDAAEVINETWHGRDESRDQSCGHEIPGNRFQI